MDEMTSEEKREFYVRLDRQDKSLDRILSILESDDKIKEKGLVERVHDNEQKLDDFLMREKIYKAKAATYGVVGGGLITVIIWVAKLFFAKFI